MRQNFNFLHKWLIEQAARSTKQPFSRNRPPTSLSLQVRDRGFALPLAVGMGLIMILVGVTMIARSQNDSVTASLQKQTSQSLAIAEGGASRSLGLLNDNYNPLLRLNYDPINPATNKTYLGPDGVLNSGDEETTAVDQWSTISNAPPCFSTATIDDDLLTGRISSDTATEPENYRLLAYRYSDPDGAPESGDEKGTLLVRGQELNSDAVSLVLQSFQVSNVFAPANFPGLLATDINLGNNDVLGAVAGNVVCTDPANCPVSECVDGEPTENGLRAAIGAQNQGVVQGEIRVGEAAWPPLPTAPAGAVNIGDIDDSMTFPRRDGSGNLTDSLIDGAYHYIIEDITLNSETLTIDSSGAPVYFYVSGDITMGGSAEIVHSGSPERFRIYGNPADNDDSNDQSFTLNGGSSTTNLFIYAPDATIGVNGGSSNPDISGAVWTKTWDGSSSNNAEISVPSDMGSLLGTGLRATFRSAATSAANSWQRQPAQ